MWLIPLITQMVIIWRSKLTKIICTSGRMRKDNIKIITQTSERSLITLPIKHWMQ